ncbi:MAG TPA: hypothetical protein DCG85_08230 [Lachnospiraceae bacterium]|nr:hypothetical protein [Lachnospiraceae bacterium]
MLSLNLDNLRKVSDISLYSYVHFFGKVIDLSQYPGFDSKRISELKGATIRGNKITVTEYSASYEYDIGHNIKMSETLYPNSLNDEAKEKVRQFVGRMYTQALGREADEGGRLIGWQRLPEVTAEKVYWPVL